MQEHILGKRAVMGRKIGILMGILFSLGVLFLGAGPTTAIAEDSQVITVNEITISKTYSAERELGKFWLSIKGSNLKDAAVYIWTDHYQPLGQPGINEDDLLQFNVAPDQSGNKLRITKNKETVEIDIDESGMPSLTMVSPKVRVGENLILEGNGLLNIKKSNDENNGDVTASCQRGGSDIPIEPGAGATNTEVEIVVDIGGIGGQLGWWDIVFKRTKQVSYNLSGEEGTVEIIIQHLYKDQFRLVKDIDITDGLEMYPTMGVPGSTLFFEAKHQQLGDYDVFFLKETDGTDRYTNTNKGKNRTFQSSVKRDILTVEVPNLPVGEYDVVLTNKVQSSSDPMEAVNQECILEQKFTIIDTDLKAIIDDIYPASGPDTGSEVTISGRFLGTLNIPGYEAGEGLCKISGYGSEELQLEHNYGEETPGSYQEKPIKKVERKIKVIIGGQATFVSDRCSFKPDLDKVTVKTAQFTEGDPIKDVVVETETILTKKEDDSTIAFTERTVRLRGYTYIPSKIKPEIQGVNPDKIQVVDSAGSYAIPRDLMVSITGNNFMVTRFVDDSSKKEVVCFPVVELGDVLTLDRNKKPGQYLRVFDHNGREVDGTTGNEVGQRILLMIDKNTPASEPGSQYVKVINPIKNSAEAGLSAQSPHLVQFVCPESDRMPIITAVNPDVSTVDGGETVSITGSNFMAGVKVFLDGQEIAPINRQGDGKKITFMLPKGREGATQLQVMNPEGGIDTRPFNYVLTYTNPQITSFAPRAGSTGTLVMVKGENFLKPEPAAKEASPLKLIGTRVLLEGEEINQYSRSSTGKIELQDYNNAEQPLLTVVEGAAQGSYLELADYYQAVLLQASDSGEIFTLDRDYKGNIILSNGVDKTYALGLDGDKSIQAISSQGAHKSLAVDETGLTMTAGGSLNLKMKTLYKVEGENRITGKKVQVLDSQTLLFTVPILEADGYYDVTVINPDTKRDNRLGQNGFYYFKLPQSKPEIVRINPGQGSVQGGYSIDIEGKGFEDNGTTKSKVIINGVEVSPQDTVVSHRGDLITVKVPAYPGDLRKDKGTDRLSVPVVVLNPDGASVGLEKGFTYVIPSSHPQISKIVPAQGSSAGGQVVEITGTDFRFFEPFDDRNRNQILDEGESYTDLNENRSWDDLCDPDIDPEWRGPVSIEHPQYEHYYSSPILPQVFFGQQPGRIVEFARGYLKVLAPAHQAGTVDVYLVNNDASISNKVKYTFQGSHPRITRITPNVGPKQGGQNVEVAGSDFAAGSVGVWQEGGLKQVQMPLVRFGDIGNRHIPREAPNGGRIDNGFATVTLEGGLAVAYKDNRELVLTVEEGGQLYTLSCAYDDTLRFLPISELSAGEEGENRLNGQELIKVSVEDRRLIVERGYAPEAQLLRSDQLSVKTPSYYTVGLVPVHFYNPDGSQATGQYEYKNPDSHPRIENIMRDGKEPQEMKVEGRDLRILRMDYRTQPLITILGQDFREGARVQVGDLFTIEARDIRYELPHKLGFVMPVIPEQSIGSIHRVLVINADGGIAASDQIPKGLEDTEDPLPIYLQFSSGETSPSISSVSPGQGPASGGTVVTILGNDFRRTIDGYEQPLEVYFGGAKIADGDVKVADYKSCQVITAPSHPGAVEVKVENPDGTPAPLQGGFTYISTPSIEEILDPHDIEGRTPIDNISVIGGQQLKIKGEGFLPGARVIFNPLLLEADVEPQGSPLYRTVEKEVGGQKSRESQAFYLQSGTEGSEVSLLDGETLLVTTPSGQLGSGGLLIVNPDGGASQTLKLDYELPELPKPAGVVAEIIHDQYSGYDRHIKVHWQAVDGAAQYETYVIRDGHMEFIGSTPLTSFIYADLRANTSYQFVVTAVGDFGSSPPSMKSNRLRTGSRAGAPDTDGKPGDKSSTIRQGNTVYHTIGNEDRGSSWSLDLSRGELAGAKEVVVAMPAALIASSGHTSLYIKSPDYELNLNPTIFNSQQIRSAAHRADAGVRLKIAPLSGSTGGVSGNTLSTPYSLTAQFYQGLYNYNLDHLAGNYMISLPYDGLKAQLRRLNQVQVNRYDPYQGRWTPLPGAYSAGGWYSLDRLGTYCVIGNRG